MKLNHIFLLLLFLISFVITGCSNTAVLKEDRGNEVRFTLTFASAPQWNTYSYYLLFFDDNTQTIDPLSHYYFVPGQTNYDQNIVLNQTGGLSYYYQTFFSKWTDFIRLDELAPVHYKGAFSATSTAQDHIDYQKETNFSPSEYAYQTGVLTFSFPLSFLSQSLDQLYFTILTVKKTEVIGNIEDLLNVVKSIDKVTGKELEETDQDVIKTPASAANLLEWKVEIL